VVPAVRRALAEIHPAIAVDFRGFQSQLSDSLLRERLMAAIAGCFGVLAALLASVGLYGVMSYSVSRRRAEIGIRMALGADRSRVRAMVLREASVLLAGGLTAGAVLALAVGRAASTLLFGLTPSDPATLAGALGVLAAVALIASYLPARRAARVEPTAALREE
jgi:ABC-type antimicrobial peptide transport system permease subunit